MLILFILFYSAFGDSLSHDQIFPNETWSSGLIDLGNGGDDIFYILYKSRNLSFRNERLIIWFQGGPGCSGFIANMMENGPYIFNKSTKLARNPYAWNEAGDLLYVDQPVGTGFSRMRGYETECYNETCVAIDMYAFLNKFVEKYPEYQQKSLYLFGQSYAGQYIPAVSAYYLKHPVKNGLILKGIGIGNGVEDFISQLGTHPTYGFEHKLLSSFEFYVQQIDALICQISLLIGNANKAQCLNAFEEMGRKVLNPNDIRDKVGYYEIGEIEKYIQLEDTRKLLNVNMRTYGICNGTIYNKFLYDMYYYPLDDLKFSVDSGISVMLYHGEYDAVCNWHGGLLVTDELKWEGQKTYKNLALKPMILNGRFGGEYKSYKNLAFVKVKDAGHFSPYNQPEFTLDLLNWPIAGFKFN